MDEQKAKNVLDYLASELLNIFDECVLKAFGENAEIKKVQFIAPGIIAFMKIDRKHVVADSYVEALDILLNALQDDKLVTIGTTNSTARLMNCDILNKLKVKMLMLELLVIGRNSIMTEEEKRNKELIVTELAKKIIDNLLKSNEYVGKTITELLNDNNLYNEAAELIIFEAALSGITMKKSDNGELVLVY